MPVSPLYRGRTARRLVEREFRPGVEVHGVDDTGSEGLRLTVSKEGLAAIEVDSYAIGIDSDGDGYTDWRES